MRDNHSDTCLHIDRRKGLWSTLMLCVDLLHTFVLITSFICGYEKTRQIFHPDMMAHAHKHIFLFNYRRINYSCSAQTPHTSSILYFRFYREKFNICSSQHKFKDLILTLQTKAYKITDDLTLFHKHKKHQPEAHPRLTSDQNHNEIE